MSAVRPPSRPRLPRPVRLRRPRRAPRAPRSGVVLVAVIVVVATALVIASGMVARSTSDRAAIAGEQRRVQQRIAAWSGVRATMAALAAERDRILDGDAPPAPPEESVLWESDGDEWIVRRLPLGPGGERIVAEAGKLDLATVTADRLLASGVLDPPTADAIIAARDAAADGRPIAAAELAAAPGVDPAAVLGPLEEVRTLTAAMGEPPDVAARVLDRLTAGRLEAATDLLTVHAVEPAIQRDGTRRIAIPETWSDELGERLNERFGDGAGGVIRGLIEGGVRFDSDSVIVEQLVAFDVPPADWGPFLDALTTDPAGEHLGRLDLNRASVAALRTLPGIDEATARAIADAREGLPAEERWTIAWPVINGLVEPEAFAEIAGLVTVRSFTWRVRVAVGRRGLEDEPTDPLRDVTVLEAVVDLAAPRPRLAELRDVTHLELAARLVLAGLDGRGGAMAGLGAEDEGLAAAGGDGGFGVAGEGGDADPFVPSFESPVPEADVGFGGGLVDPPDPASGGPEDPMDEAGGSMSGLADRPGGTGGGMAADGGRGSSGGGGSSRRRGARWLGPG